LARLKIKKNAISGEGKGSHQKNRLKKKQKVKRAITISKKESRGWQGLEATHGTRK